MHSIIFVRHGQSQANAEKMVASPDSPLSDEGRAQAKATAEALKLKGISAIACSPYARARQTAEIISAALGLNTSDIIVIDELRERGFGDKQGKPKDHETAWYYEVDNEYGIESHQALIARMQQAAAKVRALAQQQTGTLAIVGHATAGFYFQQVLKGKSKFADFDPPQEMTNAGFVRLDL